MSDETHPCIGGCGAELELDQPASLDYMRGGLCAECWTLLDAAQAVRAHFEEPGDAAAHRIRNLTKED